MKRTSQFLLRTKLHPPRISSDAITRQRLSQCFEPLAPLTLIVAPAGFGKTTLLSMWVQQCTLPNAWLSLDAYDNNRDDFITYFVCAIQTLFPAFGSELIVTFQDAPSLPPSTLARMLLDACDEAGQEFVLCMDDYHLIHDQGIHQLLGELLRYPSPLLRLVISSRNDPPLPLATLRAHGNLTEIRSNDLRFTCPETLQLFQSVEAPDIDAQTAHVLTERTEGWAASLHLARLYARRQTDGSSLTEALEITSRQLMDYLAEEVLEHLPSRVQTFLMRTSILDRLSADLCAAVVGDGLPPAQSQEMLCWLEVNGVFVTGLSDQDEWFKVHTLFQRLLRAQLSTAYPNDEIVALHRRASAWHLQHRRKGDAIRHALAAGDVTDAVQIVVQGRPALMNRGEWHRLDRWLALFPPEVIEQEPQLLMAQAWLMHNRFRRGDVRKIIDRVQELLASTDAGAPPHHSASRQTGEGAEVIADLEGEMETIQTYFSYWNGDLAGVLQHGHAALEKAPQPRWYMHSLTVMFLSIAYLAKGDPTGALALYETMLREDAEPNDAFRIQLLIARGIFRLVAGDLGNLTRDAAYLLALGQDNVKIWSDGWAAFFQATVHYHHNELTAVEQDLSGILTRRYRLHVQCFVQSVCLLGLAYHLLARNAEADALVQAAISYLIEIDQTLLLPELRGFQAELALRSGDLKRAAQIASTLPATIPPQMPFPYAYPVTLIKLCLMENNAESLQSARKLLRRLHDYARTTGNLTRLIEALILETWEHQIEGDSQRALQTLEEALQLAEPAGYIRLFADFGHVLDPLFAQLVEHGVAPLLISSIRAASHPVGARPFAPMPQPAALAIPQVDISVILTFREQDVLRLLGQRRTNLEIARELNISPDTVKRHTVNIFRKLNLNNRREAALFAVHLKASQPDERAADHDSVHRANLTHAH